MKHIQLSVHYGDNLKLVCGDCKQWVVVPAMDCLESDAFMMAHALECDVEHYGMDFVQRCKVKVDE